ncbi:hypothetical protein BJX62DRAFT_194793 [Aspergillus germanicus]
MSATLECDHAERQILISRIKRAANDEKMNAVAYAFLWLADLEPLRKIGAMFEDHPIAAEYALEHRPSEAIRVWLGKTKKRKAEEMEAGEEGSTGTPTRSTHTAPFTKRSRDAAKNCLTRDLNKCCITKTGEPLEVAHVFPFALGSRGTDANREFWKTLGMFWSESRINRWVEAARSTETPTNLITLSRDAHGLWGSARFALRPLKSSSSRLTAEVHWLGTGDSAKRVIDEKPSIDEDLSESAQGGKLFDCSTDKVIRSGHVIEFATTNPGTLPLPSATILEMQWNLHRVAAISAAADTLDDFDSESDESDEDDDVVMAMDTGETPAPVPTLVGPTSTLPTRGRRSFILTEQQQNMGNSSSRSLSSTRKGSPVGSAGHGLESWNVVDSTK